MIPDTPYRTTFLAINENEYGVKEAFRSFLIHDSAPVNVLEDSQILSIEPSYIPFHLYDVTWRGNWRAKVAHNEERIRPVTKPDRSTTEETYTVVVWEKESNSINGRDEFRFVVANHPCKHQMLQVCADRIDKEKHIDRERDPNVPKNDSAITPTHELDDRLDQQVHDKANSVAIADILGDRYEDLHVTQNILGNACQEIWVPIWTVDYKFENVQRYFVALDDENLTKICGEPPNDQEFEDKIDELYNPSRLYNKFVLAGLALLSLFAVAVVFFENELQKKDILFYSSVALGSILLVGTFCSMAMFAKHKRRARHAESKMILDRFENRGSTKEQNPPGQVPGQ